MLLAVQKPIWSLQKRRVNRLPMILFGDGESISYHAFAGILVQANHFKGEFSFPDSDSAKVVGIIRFGEEVIGISDDLPDR